MDWARILAYVTGMVDQELLARSEYLAAENRILKAQVKGGCGSRTPSEPRLARSVIDWAARFSPRWRMWPGRTPSWLGTASSSPANSMARRPVHGEFVNRTTDRPRVV
jgi:hypothetical protein